MDYTWSYVIGTLVVAVVWIALFFLRKDTRNEMLIMSGIFGLAALIVEPVYLIDWWRPLTIFGTSVGLEDFFFGAAMGGGSVEWV